MNTIHYVDGICGSGKTEQLINYSTDVGYEKIILIAQPTKALLEETARRLNSADPQLPTKIIHSENTDSVVSEITSHVKKSSMGVVLITHKSLFLLPDNFPKKNKIELFIDEYPNIHQGWYGRFPIFHKFFWEHFEFTPVDNMFTTMSVNIKNSSITTIDDWIKKRHIDDVFQNIDWLESLRHPHIQMEMSKAAYNKIEFNGQNTPNYGNIEMHGYVKPSIVDGFNSVTVMGAHFLTSMLYYVWSYYGVKFVPHWAFKGLATRHDQSTCDRITIHYLSEKNWSKNLINKFTENHDLFQMVHQAIGDVIGSDTPYIWCANNSYEDGSEKLVNGERIPNIVHGRNDWCGVNAIIFLSALNFRSSHYSWLEKKFCIRPYWSKVATAFEILYQSIMRTSLRNPDSTEPVTVIVPDRETAMYLATEIFPGAKLRKKIGADYLRVSLDKTPDVTKPKLTPIQEQERCRDLQLEQAQHEYDAAVTRAMTSAERVRKFREKQKEQMAENGVDYSEKTPLSGAERVRRTRETKRLLDHIFSGLNNSNEPTRLNEMPLKLNGQLGPPPGVNPSSFLAVTTSDNGESLSYNIYTNEKKPITKRNIMISYESDVSAHCVLPMAITTDDLVHQSEMISRSKLVSKNQNILMGGAAFDPSLSETTNKGLNNVIGVDVLMIDLDSSEIPPAELVSILGDFKWFAYNSASNGLKNGFNYRIVIPLSNTVSYQLYHKIWDGVVSMFETAGYYVGDLTKKPNHLPYAGIDRSKRSANSFFFLPSLPLSGRKRDYIFEKNWGDDTPLLGCRSFCEANPTSESETTIVKPEPSATLSPEKLKVFTVLQEHARHRDPVEECFDVTAKKEKCRNSIRDTVHRSSTGHNDIYAFVIKCVVCGLSQNETRVFLDSEIIDLMRTPSDRRKELNGILKKWHQLTLYFRPKK